MNPDFDLLLKLKELESETNFHFVIDKDNAEIYLFEPNSKEYFDKINIQKELKEIENANPIKQPDSTSVERYTCNVIGRIRSIIKERKDRSRAETSRSEETRTRDRQLCAVYGNQIWNQVSTREERDSAEQLRKKVEAQKESLKQSQTYKQQALKAYQQDGVTLTPKNLQNEITSSLNKEDSNNNPNNQETQNNSNNLFSNFTNKLNTIHQNLTNPIDTISLKDTLEIDKSKSQDNQESQDSYLKTQYQMKRSRK